MKMMSTRDANDAENIAIVAVTTMNMESTKMMRMTKTNSRSAVALSVRSRSSPCAMADACASTSSITWSGRCWAVPTVGRSTTPTLIIGAVTMVTNDVLPYGLVQGPRGALDGLNLVGLKRRGVDRSDITAMRAAFQMLAQGEGSFLDRARHLAKETDSIYVREMTDFVLSASDRSFLTPK